MTARTERIQSLRKSRPRDLFLRASLVAVGVLVLYSVLGGEFILSDLYDSASQQKLKYFWEYFSEPDPEGSPRAEIRSEIYAKTPQATLTTLWVSVASIVIAGVGAAILSGFGARNLAVPQPFIRGSGRPSAWRRSVWKLVVWGTRGFLIIVRALPEYIWAFLLIGLFGLGAWPAVLAIALHNLGILGRLGAETIENQSEQTPAALRALGASRTKIYFADLVPNAFSRWLVYFFYRWETCVREATVLGMLGLGSLGYFIMNEAYPRDLYDVVIVLTLLGAALVFLADLVSALIRWKLRTVS